MPLQQHLTKEKAQQKIKHFCAYQERSHKEVKDKLYGFGLRTREVDELLCYLIEENYLNEERFAQQFAGGRFRLKHWGKVKIEYELKQKQVSSYNIKLALKGIDETAYLQTLDKIAAAKWESLKDETTFVRQSKTFSHLLQKGFEKDLISNSIKVLATEQNK